MTLYGIFSEKEVDMILQALEAQEKKWKKVSERPIQGYGSAGEMNKKQERAKLSMQYAELQNKICENLD